MGNFNFNDYDNDIKDPSSAAYSNYQIIKEYNGDYKTLLRDVIEGRKSLSGIEEYTSFTDDEKDEPHYHVNAVGTYLLNVLNKDISDKLYEFSDLTIINPTKLDKIKDMNDFVKYFNIKDEDFKGIEDKCNQALKDIQDFSKSRKDLLSEYKTLKNEVIELNNQKVADEKAKAEELKQQFSRNLPEDSFIDFKQLLNDQSKFYESTRPSNVEYLDKVKSDYSKFLTMGDDKFVRSRFSEAFNRIAAGEKIFNSQPEFEATREGREQIFKYLDELEQAGTDAYVNLYGSNFDKDRYIMNVNDLNKNHIPYGSLQKEQMKDLIDKTLPDLYKVKECFNISKDNKNGVGINKENATNSINILKDARAKYDKFNIIQKAFGFIFNTDCAKARQEKNAIENILQTKGMSSKDIENCIKDSKNIDKCVDAINAKNPEAKNPQKQVVARNEAAQKVELRVMNLIINLTRKQKKIIKKIIKK